MSKYTTELRYVCESLYPYRESKGYNDVNDILDETWDKVFDFDFPMFDENYREALCKKILKHYYTREISEETYGLWKLRLDARMNEIMPYFNKLYNSELISIEPLVNYRVNKMGNGNKGGSDAITDTGSESIMGTNGNSRVHSGGFTDTHNGTDTNVKTGNETLGKAGKEINTKNGERSVEKIGNISDTTEYEGYRANDKRVTDGALDSTVIDLFTDTPQGSIKNMGTGYSGDDDTSGVPIVGDDTAWLTTANKTTTHEEDSRNIQDKLSYSDDYKETKTKTYNGENENNHFRDVESFEDYENTTEFENRTDTKTYNNVTNTETKNLADTRTYNNETIADNGTMSKSTTKGNSRNISYGSTNSYLETVVGSRGKSDSELLTEFRKTFLNIDEMVIARLSDLFLYLW